MEERLVAPCGMNCALCVSYQAMKQDLRSRGLRRKYCAGCLPRGENCVHMRHSCAMLGEGRVRFCFECESFPCRRLKSLDRRYRSKYHMSMLDNLARIQAHGMEQFLQDERTKWVCPECGDMVCCHIGLCLNCDLEKLLENRRYRWNE